MDDWKDIFFKSGIRAIMTAPRGQPSYNLLDAFHRAYNQHELDKSFSEDKKNNVATDDNKKIFQSKRSITYENISINNRSH